MDGIKTINLYKRFRENEVLKGLSFEVSARETTLLAGRNGAGKTTWLRITLGLAKASSGSVLFGGKCCMDVRDTIAVVFDEPPVYPSLSGRENLMIMSGSVKNDSRWTGHIKKILNLETSFLNMKAAQYSLGQRRRLATAAALLRKPKYLFLDEPTVGLDPVAWEMIRNSLRSLVTERGSTIILTGQDFDAIEKFADKVVVLKNGVSVFGGDLNEFMSLRSPRVRISTADFKTILTCYPAANIIVNEKIVGGQKCSVIEIGCATRPEAEKVMQDVQALNVNFESLGICTDSLEEAFLAIEKAEC